MADVALNGLSGREFWGLVLAVGVGSWLDGPVIFPPQLASKGCCNSNQAKMIEGWCRRKREVFATLKTIPGRHC